MCQNFNYRYLKSFRSLETTKNQLYATCGEAILKLVYLKTSNLFWQCLLLSLLWKDQRSLLSLKKNPNRLYKQKVGFYYLWYKMFVYFIKYANTRHCQSLTSTVNQECYSCRGSMICFLLGYCCRDFHGKSFHCTTFVLLSRDFDGKRLCCTAFVLQLKRFYGKSFRCTAFVHGLFDGVKDTNSTSWSPPGQSFSSLKQFIGTGHYIL